MKNEVVRKIVSYPVDQWGDDGVWKTVIDFSKESKFPSVEEVFELFKK